MSHSSDWTQDQIGDLGGKSVIVTGANSGLGWETAKALAQKGAKVVMACRDAGRAERARSEITEIAGDASVSVMALDLADLPSVKAFAEAYKASNDRLDILCNNAGVMAIPLRRTSAGFEMQMGTNHFGHFALTGRLLDIILATPDSRVVTLSSHAHRFGKVDFDDIHWEKSYSRWPAYGQSKLANLLFAYELDRRLRSSGATTLSVASHPGYAATNLQTAGPRMDDSSLQERIALLGNRLLAQSAEMGALPTLRAATDPAVGSGEYYGPGGFMGQHGYPVRVESTARSKRADDAARLWELSEELTGVSYAGMD